MSSLESVEVKGHVHTNKLQQNALQSVVDDRGILFSVFYASAKGWSSMSAVNKFFFCYFFFLFSSFFFFHNYDKYTETKSDTTKTAPACRLKLNDTKQPTKCIYGKGK